jgi:hypothetical protein
MLGSWDLACKLRGISFGGALVGRVRIRIESCCAEHGAPVGRSPPRSTTRKRKVRREGGRKRSRLGEFCGRTLGSGPFFFSLRVRASARGRSSTLCEKKRSQFATSSLQGPLTPLGVRPSVRLAPSTERPRLMALRSAVASAAVSRKAGRRRHRLGAFLFGPPRRDRFARTPTSRPAVLVDRSAPVPAAPPSAAADTTGV